MPDLRVGDDVPTRLRRVAVAGPSGCGKSTLARRIGEILDLPYTDLDSLNHGPESRAQMGAAVSDLIAGSRWVCEYQYALARRLIRQRADLVVWLHLPRRVGLWRLLRRKLGRRLRPGRVQQRDWPGWDPPLRQILTDRREFAHYTRGADRQQTRRARRLAKARGELAVVHLYSAAEVEQWMQRLVLRTTPEAQRPPRTAVTWPALTPAP